MKSRMEVEAVLKAVLTLMERSSIPTIGTGLATHQAALLWWMLEKPVPEHPEFAQLVKEFDAFAQKALDAHKGRIVKPSPRESRLIVPGR